MPAGEPLTNARSAHALPSTNWNQEKAVQVSERRVLMVAFHFPPLAGSSGIQRTLRFARDLPVFGWQPIILTAHPRAYERVDPGSLCDLPEGLPVIRAQAFDTARHLSLFGRYPGALARPDRLVSWWAGGLLAGLGAVRRFRPDAIWSSYPIATAHLIGNSLQRRTGLPWIADFRDPMAHDGYPADPADWQSFKRVEERVFRAATCATFTTPGSLALYRERYRGSATELRLLENGFDEREFADAERITPPHFSGPTLLHSGIVYPEWRDPDALFAALANLRRRGHPFSDKLRLRFRAPVHGDFVRQRASAHGVEDALEILPPIPYADALSEMLAADALLVLQSRGCNEQIPAKTYEYLRAGRPILALADLEGDTAGLLADFSQVRLAPLDNVDLATDALAELLSMLANGSAPKPEKHQIARFDRRSQAKQLAGLLECSMNRSPVTPR